MSDAVTPLGYSANLDRLRAVCILGVLASHLCGSTPWAKPAQLGVDAFFVLSGFLITTLLLEERASKGSIELGRFYLRRAARLMPALLLLLAITAPVGALLWPEERGRIATSVASVLFYVCNWVMVASPAPVWVLSHCWSLSVEEQFYLLWPPILALSLNRLPRPERLLRPLIGMILAIGAWRFWLVMEGASDRHLLFGSDVRADQLLVGCLVAILRRTSLLPQRLAQPSASLPIGCLSAFSIVTAVVWPHHRTMFILGRPIITICVALLILYLVARDRPPIDSPVDKALIGLGRISYGVYLWHLPLYLLFMKAWPQAGWSASVGAALLSVAIASASYRWLERPIQRWVRATQARIAMSPIAPNSSG